MKQPRDPAGKFILPAGADDFQAYCTNHPVEVRDPLKRTQPPENWPYGPQAWQYWRERALAYVEAKQVYDFICLLARGYRVREVLSDRLDAKSYIGPDGQVIRPAPTDLSPGTLSEARRLHTLVAERRTPMNPVLAGKLEHAARGYGVDREVQRLLKTVNHALAEQANQQRQQEEERKSLVPIMVNRRFTALGKHFNVGELWLTTDQLQALERWKQLSEQQAKEHDWIAPLGYVPQEWPPYRLLKEKDRVPA